MRLAFHQLGLLVEPAGSVALAAASLMRPSIVGMRVAIILTGGNLSHADLRTIGLR